MKYWAGGFGKGDDAYKNLKNFIEKNYWAAIYWPKGDKDPDAIRTRELFKQIEIGDKFLIKGLGGRYSLKVHYIGQVQKKDEKNERLEFKKIDIKLYRGIAPKGKNAGGWFDTLIEVKRADIVKLLFNEDISTIPKPALLQVFNHEIEIKEQTKPKPQTFVYVFGKKLCTLSDFNKFVADGTIEILSSSNSSVSPKSELIENNSSFIDVSREIQKRRIKKAGTSINTTGQFRKGTGAYVTNPKHNEIQKSFVEHLKNKFNSVGDRVEFEENYVDIKLLQTDCITLYEVKPYNRAEDCIRSGLGQLLSYVCFDTSPKEIKIRIVGPCPPNKEEIKFITFLKDTLSIDFEYEHFKVT
jgi:hypothetical protein